MAFNYRVLDTDNDGAINFAELESYLSSQEETGAPFSSVAAESTSDILFRELDVNGDRILTAPEISNAIRLFDRDLDGNQVITIEELRGRSMGRLPPEFIASVPGHLAPKGTLQIRNDEEFASSAPPEAGIDILIDFGKDDARASAPNVTVKINEKAAELGFRVGQNTGRNVVLTCDQRIVVLRILSPMTMEVAKIRQSLQQEFDSLSGSSSASGSVPAGSDMSPALKATFPLADRNRNDELDQTELQRYLDQLLAAQLIASQGRLRGVIFAEQPGLLPLVDSNRDGRLSRRELQATAAVVKPFLDADGMLPAQRLPLTTMIVLQRGQLPLTDGQKSLLNSGPTWFTRADRNADGDLDRDEFPGSVEDFERLDRNNDGWIDADEAISADNDSKGNSR